ncbi:transcription factor bHLH126-like [Lycium ferocissimum]|uniref:transcription factor bHLH126-like n=1 Tax=Lycium ferocissimum TaxID=112874 RepID=UPI0028153836|nr:transcription factor bHLH126-like [Lycium ferocissimum]
MESLWEIFNFSEIQDCDHQELQIPSTPCQIPHQDLVKRTSQIPTIAPAEAIVADFALIDFEPSNILSLERNYINKKKRSRRLPSDPNRSDEVQMKDQNKRRMQPIQSPSLDQNKLIRRIAHRDIERQRRQEMANLYASLRSHLPLQYIKGKRPVSEHMEQALNYIQHLKNNIKELETRRDKMKILDNSSNEDNENIGQKCNLAEYVKVNKCEDGVEILIKNKFAKEGLQLSRVLEELMNRKLNVVTCVSTKVDETILHKIQVEVTDFTCMDVSSLEQKLAELLMLNLP